MRYATLLERSIACRANLQAVAPVRLEGRVTGLSGLMVDIDGLCGHVSVGDRLILVPRDGQSISAEIVGFRNGLAQAMPFAALDGLGPGSAALCHVEPASLPAGPGFAFGGGGPLRVADGWLGRVLDPLGGPLDDRGPLPAGPVARRVRAIPPAATQRARLGGRLDLGVRALNCFTTCRRGQCL